MRFWYIMPMVGMIYVGDQETLLYTKYTVALLVIDEKIFLVFKLYVIES